MTRAKFARYMPFLLEAIRQLGGSARPAEAVEWVQSNCEVPTEDLERTVSGGQSAFANQVHWCRNYLREAGLIDASQRGVWQLTAEGRRAQLQPEDVSVIVRETRKRNQELRREKAAESILENDHDDAVDDLESGSDDTASYRETALQSLKQLTPAGFERFSQLLLREAGFSSVVVTGKSGDGGIDGRGVLRVNSLVSFNICFQCKRYDGSVGPSYIRDFRGAIVGRADRGLLITTATFSAAAKDEAKRDGAMPIQLVDGETIVDMMEELQLGLRPVQTFAVEPRFFDQFND